MNFLDIAIVIILLLGIISGFRRGFIVSILNIISIIATFIICFAAVQPISKLIFKYTNIAQGINSVVTERINSLDPFTVLIVNKLKISGMDTNEFLTASFLNIAIFIVLFLGITVIMSFLKEGIRKNIKRSILGPVDSLFGGVLGFLKWVLILMLIFAFATPIIPLLKNTNQFYTLINGSYLADVFINYNFITTMIMNFIDESLKGLINL